MILGRFLIEKQTVKTPGRAIYVHKFTAHTTLPVFLDVSTFPLRIGPLFLLGVFLKLVDYKKESFCKIANNLL